MGLLKTLIDRTFKINNTCMGFHNDLQTLFVMSQFILKQTRSLVAPYLFLFALEYGKAINARKAFWEGGRTSLILKSVKDGAS